MEGNVVTRSWGTMLVKGLLALAFGVVLIVWPEITFRVLIRLFGILALLFGAVFTADFFVGISRGEKWGWSLAAALISIFIGIMALARTYETAVIIAFFFVIWLLMTGAIETGIALILPREFKFRWLLGAEGVLSIIAGLCLMLFTAPTARLIVLFVGVYYILMGMIDIVVSFEARKFFRKFAGAAAAEEE